MGYTTMANAPPAAPDVGHAVAQKMVLGASQKYGMSFEAGVLKSIGAPVTPHTTSALNAWVRAEGGPSDNPLNTTLGQGNAQGSAIKGYGSVPAGISATTKTLQNGLYGSVLQAFRRNESPDQIRAAIIASPWSGSSHYAGTDYAKGLVTGAASGGAAPASATTSGGAAPPAKSVPLPGIPAALMPTPAPAAPTTKDALTSLLLASNGKPLTASQLLGAVQPTQAPATVAQAVSAVPTSPGVSRLPPAVVPGKGDPVAGSTPAPPTAVKDLVSAANQISGHHYNYEWGGGHNATFAPASGSGHGSGPGVGYDCSGAISAILHAAGKLDQPMVAQQFMSYGLPGPGSKSDLTIYASPTHVFAEINGRFFGTSMANPGGGAGWFAQAATAGYTVRHVSLAGGPNLHLNDKTGTVIPYRTAGTS